MFLDARGGGHARAILFEGKDGGGSYGGGGGGGGEGRIEKSEAEMQDVRLDVADG